MKNKKNIFIFILGLILPFIGAIISMFIKNEETRRALKRGSVISGIVVFLVGIGISFYFIGAELAKSPQ